MLPAPKFSKMAICFTAIVVSKPTNRYSPSGLSAVMDCQALGVAAILGYLLGRPKACKARYSLPRRGSLYSLETAMTWEAHLTFWAKVRVETKINKMQILTPIELIRYGQKFSNSCLRIFRRKNKTSCH